LANRRQASSPLFFDARGAHVSLFPLPRVREWSAGRRQGAWRSALWRALTEPAARPRQDPGCPGLPLRGRAPPLTEGAAPPGAPLAAPLSGAAPPMPGLPGIGPSRLSAIATSLEMTRAANKVNPGYAMIGIKSSWLSRPTGGEVGYTSTFSAAMNARLTRWRPCRMRIFPVWLRR